METSGSIPGTAVAPPELVELLDHRGPFVSVYLTTEAEIPNAAYRSEQRWKTLRNELEAQDAPAEILDDIDALVPDAHLSGQCLTVIAAADGYRHVEHQPDPPKSDIGQWAPLPVLGPLLEWHQHAVPHVVVLADRRGADLIAFQREGRSFIREVDSADDAPLTKVAPGGWSQRKFQQRAENAWENNAKEVVAELDRLTKQIDAALVVLAGDVRAVQMIRDHAGDELAQSIRVVDGGRATDGSSDSVAADATRLVATVVAAETRAVLEKFKEENGQDDRASDGIVATIDALNNSRVALLLVPGDVDGDSAAWFGDEPIPIALERDVLTDLGVESPRRGPLLDVLIRAALGTGAGVRIIPSAGGPREGVGAILRW